MESNPFCKRSLVLVSRTAACAISVGVGARVSCVKDFSVFFEGKLSSVGYECSDDSDRRRTFIVSIFSPKKSRKGIFFCTISATRDQQKTFGSAFVWCGGLSNVKRTPFVFAARLAVPWRKVHLCCEEGKPGFFSSRTQRKIGKSFFLLVIQYTFYAHTNTGVASRCVRQISTGRVKWIKQIIMTQGHVTALDV